MNTKRAQYARNQLLTTRQQEIVIGTLLGDGYLDRTTSGFALRVNHGIQQQAYVAWKYQELAVFTNSGPYIYNQRSCYFRTVTHPYFVELRSHFYVENRKIVPPMLASRMTPLVLSVWIMDDGSNDKGQLRLNTQSFSQQENEALIGILRTKLEITAKLNRDKARYRLRISATSMPRVRQLVAPYILPSMQYKLSP